MRVGGGCTWGEVDAATHEHGLAVPCGVISTTGVGGLTLGGGHRPSDPRLRPDDRQPARRPRSCSPTGTQVTASADENPDLFWAIRGGGGNFGVVTEFTFRAQPVDDVVGGPTFWAIEDTDELLAAYREYLPTLPRNASGFFCFHTVPPGPPFPEEIHLRKVCGIVWCIVGSDEEAEQAMAPMLAVAEPLMHGVAADAAAGAEQRVRRALRARATSGTGVADFVNEIPDEAIDAERGVERQDADAGSRVAHLPDRRRGARRRAPTRHRWAYRDTRWSQVIIGVDPDPALGAGASRLDGRLLGGAAPVLGRRRVRQLHDGRGPGAGEGDLRRQLRPARAGRRRRTTRRTSSASTRTSIPREADSGLYERRRTGSAVRRLSFLTPLRSFGMSMQEESNAGVTMEELQLAARNHGMPLEALRYPVTPTGLHYLLVHYDIPAVEPGDWRLTIRGRVRRVLSLRLEELRHMPPLEVAVTMECAGNGRAHLEPRPISQPWLAEAIGTGLWRGVSLRALLEEAGLEDDAAEILFTGLDRGVEGEVEQHYARSVPVDEAVRDEVVLAYELNGAPLPPQHGYPLRLVVPGWYGMTNVKWLDSITVLSEPFEGYQQVHGYRIRLDPDDEGTPVTRMVRGR